MSKRITNSKSKKLPLLPPINKKNTDTDYDLFEFEHGYKLPSTFNTDSKYNKILETQTGTETPRGTLPSLLNTDLKEQKLISMIKADKYLPPINIKSKTVWEDKPSRMWCEKGILDREHGERYHPDRHHGGDNAYERCVEFYKEYDKPEWGKPELGIISGGKKRTRRNRKNKKTRKQRRKSFRRNKK